MEDAKRVQCLNAVNLTAGIRNKESYQIDLGQHTPLINNLEIGMIFKDKAEKERVSVTDLINRIVQVLKEDLYWIKISAQDTGLMEPVELQDKGQLSHITGHEPHTKRIYVLTYSRTERTDVLKY